jgi:glucosylceramidase
MPSVSEIAFRLGGNLAVMVRARLLAFGFGLAFLAAACAAKGPSGATGTGGTGNTGGATGQCGSGLMACNGSCVNVQTDNQNCGTCQLACDTGTVCQGGSCVCATGLFSCSGQCVSSNTDHCGASCAACPSGNVCNDGQCASSCGSGSTMCGDGACSSNIDSAHCGTSCTLCGGGASCTNGTCTCGVSGQQNCNGTCIDTSSNASNCGSCGQACGSGQSCLNGTCTGGGSTGGATGTGGAGTGGTGPTGGASGTVGTGGTGSAGTTGTGGTGTTNQPLLVTSANNAYWKTTGTLTTVTSGTATVTVNDTSPLQTWEGFGGAFNEVGWNVISMLSASDQAKAIDDLFGSDAAHFAVGRIPIGASDYALTRYTDDETSGDTNLTSFSITQDMKYLIPYVKAAQATNPSLKLWASPWTPPTWMKTTTGSVNGTACKLVGSTMFDGGCMTAGTNNQNLSTYADYFVKWVAAYAAQQIPIALVSAQNEPNYAQGYPSCLWTSAMYDQFVGQYLGPALSKAGMGTQILGGTMSNNNSNADPTVVTAIMGDATAKGFIKVLGYQWGMEQFVKADIGKYSPLHIWQTEHRCGNYPGFTPSNPTPMDTFNSSMAPNDWGYGWETWELIRTWINDGVTSYSAWNMVLDTVGKGNDTTRNWPQDALLTVNTSSKTLTATPAYYVFRHCSQYVQVGATVVGTSGGEALAWKNPDGSLVAVMYNSGSATTYTVAIAGKKLQFAMPSQGWATVYVPAS